MANSNAPTGLRPVRYRSGAPYNGACNTYSVPATDGTALFVGDPVIVAGSADALGVPTITRATATGGAYITGVIVGFEPLRTDLTVISRVASTARNVYVADDPALIFEVQEDAIGGALAAVDVGLNVDLIATQAGSTTTGKSGWQADTSTKATTNTLQLRIEGFVQREDNEVGSANAKILVSINLHQSRNLTGV
jgi:hypothetical protein